MPLKIIRHVNRILCGLGMGIEGTIHPVYVCELTSPSLRGNNIIINLSLQNFY